MFTHCYYITEVIFFIISYNNSQSFFQSSVLSESTLQLSPARVLISVLCLLLNLLVQPLKIIDLSISKQVVIGKVFSLMLVPSLETLFAYAFCNHAARACTPPAVRVSVLSAVWRKVQTRCSVPSFSFLSVLTVLFNIDTEDMFQHVH